MAPSFLLKIPFVGIPGRSVLAHVLEPIALNAGPHVIEESHDRELVRDLIDELPRYLDALSFRNRGEVFVEQRIELGILVTAAIAAREIVLRQRGPRAMEVGDVGQIGGLPIELEPAAGGAVLSIGA